jgi:hypothetical protein
VQQGEWLMTASYTTETHNIISFVTRAEESHGIIWTLLEESFTCMPLQKLLQTYVPLKSSLAPVCRPPKLI